MSWTLDEPKKGATPILRCTLACIACATIALHADALRPVRAADRLAAAFVDPFIGTAASNSPHPVPGGAGGSTIPGAMAPFGMVQLSPDTPHGSPSGYAYVDSVIEQFSMTHFNGAGCANKEDFPFLPITGDLDVYPGADWRHYASSYRHAKESAAPGFYEVTLDRYGIHVELTATVRTGFARLTYPADVMARLLFNASRNATGERDGSFRIMSPTEVAATVTGGGFCGGKTYPIYFVARFDRPFQRSGTWQGGAITPDGRTSEGEQSGGWVEFDASANPTVQMQVGMSYVSSDNARANLRAENPSWKFDEVRRTTAAAWEKLLERVAIEGGANDDRRKFYTALYHVFSNPNVYSDANGQYRGFDAEVHQADGYVNYQNWSGWDIYRSWIQLVAAIAPETRDFMRSMVAAGREGGLLPMWSDVNQEDHIMVGDPGPVIVASAHAFGVRDFDTAAALRLMHASGSDPEARTQGSGIRSGLDGWMREHYFAGNAAVALEYAQADFAVGQYAEALEDTQLAITYLRRAQNWKNHWNESSGYIHPRNENGWLTPFDPARGTGFVEGNAAQYTWMVPFGLRALIDRMGGDAAAIARLDALFAELNAGTDRPHFYIGNEPQFATPWAYAFAGAPWKTQAVVRRIVTESFTTAPGGLPGNDDLGATSSWLVWAFLGMYPAIPGTDVLVLHGPSFPRARVRLANGRTLEIRAKNTGPDAPYVQSVRWKGTPLERCWMRFAEIANGGTLEFTMGSNPNPNWGASDRPPSFDGEVDPAPLPIPAASRPHPPGENVALHQPATADDVCGANEGPEKAVNGSVSGGNSDKWCSLGPARWLCIDLVATREITGFVIQHAGAGWEDTDWNTKDFDLDLSDDGTAWRTVASVRGNRASVTTHPITPQRARYARLHVITPENCCGTGAARIYEFEVYATEE